VSQWPRFGRSGMGRCSHDTVVTTVTAGLERSVCESCGNVSVGFVEEAVKLHSELAAKQHQRSRRSSCFQCDRPATFIVPSGVACGEHAWALATRHGEIGAELWIPIRIDQAPKPTA
jgi:hypothetical protein